MMKRFQASTILMLRSPRQRASRSTHLARFNPASAPNLAVDDRRPALNSNMILPQNDRAERKCVLRDAVFDGSSA
jgi:hypothetical protein